MKNIFLSSLLLLSSQAMLGMNPGEVNNMLDEINLGIVSLVLDMPINEVKKYQALDPSKIKNITCTKNKNQEEYTAWLDNDDTISATFYSTGPLAGQCECSRILFSKRRHPIIPLKKPSMVFYQLEKLYKQENLSD